jgi:polar amino acid transport system substrate-binding protein
MVADLKTPALFICALITAGSTYADSECKEIVYATNSHYPPYSWSADNASYLGASVALLQLLAPAGVNLRPAVFPWKRALLMAKKGEIDLLLSLRITPEREEYLVFTGEPAFPNPIVVFALRTSNLKSADWKQLENYRGGVSLGDTFGGGFDDYLKQHLRVESALTLIENFEKLKLGRIDYYLSSENFGRSYLSINGNAGEHKIVALSPPISRESIHFGFSRKSRCLSLLPGMNAKLTKLNMNGVPNQLLKEATQQFAAQPAEKYVW